MLPTKKFVSFAIVLLLGGGVALCPTSQSLASDKNRLPASAVQGRSDEAVTLKVSPFGIVVSFEDLDESIERYWATDDRFLRIGTNAPLGPDANLLFLKTNGKWDDDDGTAVTIQTKDVRGRIRTYNFLVEFTGDRPKYSILRIYPDGGSMAASGGRVAADRPAPPIQSVAQEAAKVLPPQVRSAVPKMDSPDQVIRKSVSQGTRLSMPSAVSLGGLLNSPSRPDTPAKPDEASEDSSNVQGKEQSASPDQEEREAEPNAQPPRQADLAPQPAPETMSNATNPKMAALLLSHSQANALVRGLTVAGRTGEVGRQSITARKIKVVVSRLRRGEALTVAAKREAVESKTIYRLLQLGNFVERNVS
jgi:hypothetical protein